MTDKKSSTTVNQEPIGKRPTAFELKMKGIEREYLFEYEDERGKCYIGYAGGMPEREHAFYYGDGNYEFCFCADCKYEGQQFDINVKNATIYHMHGPKPHIDPKDIDRIRSNMAKFFSTRDFLTPSKPIYPGEKFRNLTLSWLLP